MILETAVLGWGLYNKFKASRVDPRNVERVRALEAERLRIEGERLRLQRAAGVRRSIIELLLLAALACGGFVAFQHRNAILAALSPRESVTLEAAQKQAVERYPLLGIAGSKMNTAYLVRYRSYQQTRPDYFRDSSWPLKLADEIARDSDRP